MAISPLGIHASIALAILIAALPGVAAAGPTDDVIAAVKKAEAAGSWEFVAVNKMGKETGFVQPPSYAFGQVEGGPSTLIFGGKQYIKYAGGNYEESRYHGTMSILYIIPPVYGSLSSAQISFVGWKSLPNGKPAKLYHIAAEKGALDLYIGNDGFPYRLVTPEGSVDYSNFGRPIHKVHP